jgi:hypothetical protein
MEIEGCGGAAIRALGSFFKLTEVYIWSSLFLSVCIPALCNKKKKN